MESEQQVMLLGHCGRQTYLSFVGPRWIGVVVENRATVVGCHSTAAVYHLKSENIIIVYCGTKAMDN